MLSGLVVGNAAMRELSHPKRKKCAVKALDILFRSRRTGRVISASKIHCGQRSSCQTLLLISTQDKTRRL